MKRPGPRGRTAAERCCRILVAALVGLVAACSSGPRATTQSTAPELVGAEWSVVHRSSGYGTVIAHGPAGWLYLAFPETPPAPRLALSRDLVTWEDVTPEHSQISAVAEAQCGSHEAPMQDLPEAYHMNGDRQRAKEILERGVAESEGQPAEALKKHLQVIEREMKAK